MFVVGGSVSTSQSKCLITIVIAAILLFNFTVLVWHCRSLTWSHGPRGRTLSKHRTKQRSLLGTCNLNILVCWLLTRNLEVFEPPDSRDPRAHAGLCQSAVGLCGWAMVLLTQVAQPGGGTSPGTCTCRWGDLWENSRSHRQMRKINISGLQQEPEAQIWAWSGSLPFRKHNTFHMADS